MAYVVQVLAALLSIFTLMLISRALEYLVWRPYSIARLFGRQGIRGPPYRFVVGSLHEFRRMLAAGRATTLDVGCHNYASHVYPYFQKWGSDYGKTFLYWIGPMPAMCSTDKEVVKQVLVDSTNSFEKDYLHPSLEVILGKGLTFAGADDWKRHRKVLHPIFQKERLKSTSAMTLEYTQQMMERWCTKLQEGDDHQIETDMSHDSEELTIRVIEQVTFSKNYKEAREAYAAGKELQELVVYAFSDPPIPGFRYLPTRRNRRSWQLDKLMTNNIMKIIKARLASGVYGDDLLGLMLHAHSMDAKTLSVEEIIGECKTIFAAGQDTTANLLTWAMFLLSSYPQWQGKVREELLRECQDDGEAPSIETLGKLKLLNMFLLETLRLYPPSAFLFARKTTSDTLLTNIIVPKGTLITIPLAMLHRDREVWGPDADEFNPMRFKNGVSKAANHPHAMLAFSYGPRACPGQNFAMIEVQTVLAMILRRFSFSLSPKYVHRPTNFITLMPRFGLPLIVRNLPDGRNDYI